MFTAITLPLTEEEHDIIREIAERQQTTVVGAVRSLLKDGLAARLRRRNEEEQQRAEVKETP